MATPLDAISREHEQVLGQLSLLRTASLCLRMAALKPRSVVRDKGIDHLAKVLGFFDKELRLHFRREEELLFPALEKHIGLSDLLDEVDTVMGLAAGIGFGKLCDSLDCTW